MPYLYFMVMHQLHAVQFFPKPIEEIWAFMSNPANLGSITPPDMEFTTLSGDSETTYPGQIIRYTIKPFSGIRMQWVTEITHVEAPYFFVDEQRFGPYAFWHHQHRLSEKDGGTEMTDLVHYALPLGALGNLFHSSLVRPKLEKIFSFRKNELNRLFQNHGI